MASVFLSYDHQDIAKARQVALVLEKAGHEVWWDRHIHGGAQYAKEIEQALDRADAVVVLWSKHSVDSEWVRDEAAAGKTRRRLVPTRIDQSEPPLGFRQYQVIDLSTSRGRKGAAAREELHRAIHALSGDSIRQPIGAARQLGPSPKFVLVAASLALLALVGAALFAWKPWQPKADTPVVIVEARDQSEASAALANSLFVQLGSLQASRGDLLQLSEPRPETDPDLVLKVASQPARDGSGSASVALIDGNKSTLLWSKEFGTSGTNAADLRQQIAYATAKVLECAAEGSSPDGKTLDGSTYKLYLNGCADLSTGRADQIPRLLEIFRKVTTEAPDFTGAWSHLLITGIYALSLAGDDDSQLRRKLQADIDSARKVQPDLIEAYLAEGELQPPRPISGWMRLAEKAVQIDPNHSLALFQRAHGMIQLGRMKEAVVDSRKAVQFDPLSPSMRHGLIYVLLEAGENSAARKELSEVERLWPGSGNAMAAQFLVASRNGDPRRALAMARSGELPAPVAPLRLASLEAIVAGTPESIERAIQHGQQQFRMSPANGLGPYLQVLAEFGRTEEAMKALLSSEPAVSPEVIAFIFRPAFHNLRRDPRFMTVAKRFGLIDYWRGSGKWPDFCSQPDLPYDCRVEAGRVDQIKR